MSLEDKVLEILAQVGPVNMNSATRLTAAKSVEAIKRTFIADGWVKPTLLTREGAFEATKDPVYLTPTLMTGPEWLARLEKELRTEMQAEQSDLDDIYLSDVMTLEDIMVIAKRASGVSNV